jgi:16S rRNA (guanine527-N7)-methyltransferase
MKLILKYFPDITDEQKRQFEMLEPLYKEWNEQINVVSRKDIDELYTRHILHSLAIAKIVDFKDGSKILDVGTGGGFPGIPLAILFPKTHFFLVDSIGKKIKVVKEVANALGLKNLEADHIRAEEVKFKYDFIVSRAVTNLPKFNRWIRGKFNLNSRHKVKNGLLYLKGGDLTEELKEAGRKHELYDIPDFFEEEFFETKKVVYLKAF